MVRGFVRTIAAWQGKDSGGRVRVAGGHYQKGVDTDKLPVACPGLLLDHNALFASAGHDFHVDHLPSSFHLSSLRF